MSLLEDLKKIDEIVDKFKNDKRKLYLIGMSFDQKKKRVEDILVEALL